MKGVVLAVALSGCWHFGGAGEPPPTESRVTSDARRDVGGRGDAGVADAAGDEAAAADTQLAAGSPGRRGRRAPPVDAGVVAAPPGCVVGRVIAMTVVGSRSETVLTVGAGSNRGVATSWTAALPDLPQASVRMLRVAQGVTVVKVTGVTVDDLRGGGVVVLCP